MTAPTLPDMPEPDSIVVEAGRDFNAYTADQMRAYARAALSAAPAFSPALTPEGGCVQAAIAAPAAVPVAFDAEGFRAWVLRELPDDTIIGKGAWWADHLTKCVQWFVKPSDPAAPFDVEAMLTACVPGGASCDPQHVADAIRAYCAAPAAPVGDVQPVANMRPMYGHQLLDHEGRGNGVWLCVDSLEVCRQAHTPGETSEEIRVFYSAPTVAQQAAEPTEAQIALLDPWMRPAAARELLRQVLAVAPAAHAQQQAATVQPLTVAQAFDLWDAAQVEAGSSIMNFARAIERRCGITATQQAPTDTKEQQ